jgi:hypothetical protein
MKKPPLGKSDFRSLIEDNLYFVDKSLFIKDIIENSSDIILFPRPRRFGKTLTLSMLRYFFEKVENKNQIKQLFKNLSIEKEPLFKEHLCRYPVIYLTFKDIKYDRFDDSYDGIKTIISEEFEKHDYLLDSDKLSDLNKKEFQEIINKRANNSSYSNSLKVLTGCLSKYHRKKVVLLIDEYDTPIHTAFYRNYYEEMITFFRIFLGAGLKDNPHVFKGVITGILRVAKESIFSDLNNPEVYSIIRREFESSFGFTEGELVEMLDYYGISNKKKFIKKWYDGYVFGKTKIYNPWSILSFVKSIDKEFRPYWINTSSNNLIKDLIKNSSRGIKNELNDLLRDKPIRKEINENISFETINTNDVSLYSFLLFCGYLKAFDLNHTDEADYYRLLIPNLEVKRSFRDIISGWIKESKFENENLKIMLKALVTGDIELFADIFEDFILETLSYFMIGKKQNVEYVYQAFILGMFVNLMADYDVSTEKESGYGRYDVSIVPKDRSKLAIIMELKVIRKKETKDTALKNAIKQLNEKKYETGIIKQGIKDFKKLAVVFDGKLCWVKEC